MFSAFNIRKSTRKAQWHTDFVNAGVHNQLYYEFNLTKVKQLICDE